MPQTPHVEKHFTGSEIVRDIVIGMSDGLTVPFALAAGLSGIAHSTAIVITGGLAEIAAGSIAMGLGGYLAARSDVEHYANERLTEQREVEVIPAKEKEEVEQVLLSYGLEKDQSKLVAEALSKRPEAWIDFMMRFELGLEKPDPTGTLYAHFQCRVSALVLGHFYAAGAAHLWVCQRPLHRRASHSQRAADRPDRRTGCGCGLWPGQVNFEIGR